VTRDVPPGKLAVGVPARIREPRTPPPAGGSPETTERPDDRAEPPEPASP
jgi:acetyltransferase-like isoleucine patch superfamily enzyme